MPADAEAGGALGGVNIRSCSRDVEIIDCDIDGGKGFGIALGHGRYYADDVGLVDRYTVLKEGVTVGVGELVVDEEGAQPDPCLCEEGDDPQGPPTPFEPKTYLPGGPIEDPTLRM
ncbi:hypothetical protein DB30_03501 [Enhygromyxa salina]|uniref:Right handed beta helix domain-containing protein n=1 Tax=Enhygromyxa salina TaxID=215803 RepID=A0A0C2CJW7_9BACT|nr:hypothetical protein DB30_03501 [Enhygromyxa salina]